MTAPTNTAAVFGGPEPVLVLEAPVVEVRLDGRPDPRVRLDWIEGELGAAPRAAFSVGFGHGPAAPDDLRLEQAAVEVRPGRTVQARLLRGGVLPGAERGDLVLFDGAITRIEMGLGPEGEDLRFEAEDLAGQVLRQRVGGQRIQMADGSPQHAPGLDLVFDPEGRPNASAETDAIFVPPGAPGASAWTLAEAVAYLLAEHGESDVLDVPSAAEARTILPDTVLGDVRLEGLTLGEALEALLEPVGGHVAVAVQPGPAGVGRRLELRLPGRVPAVCLAHQPAGEAFDPSRTLLSDLAARMEFDAAPRRYVARGDRRIFEATLDLVRGWDDALVSYDWWQFIPSLNPNFEAVRDVFRKWALNEAGDYSGPPYSRGDPPDLGPVFEGAAYVQRRRRFLEGLSRDALGRARGVLVEWSFDGGTTWQRLAMPMRILPDECGLYLTGDTLRPEYLWACMIGSACVRVTAALESDSCLVAEWTAPLAETLPGRTRHIEVPAGYRYRKVTPLSQFYGQAADEADDSARLEDLVKAAAEADARCPAPSRIRIPYLALGYAAGLRVEGLRGRRLDLARTHAAGQVAPIVRRVRHQFAPQPETVLELE
jgi:hypothetical protein